LWQKPSGDVLAMGLLDRWRKRKHEREREALTMKRMLTDEERLQQEIPAETYLSQTRD
jgi:hypothetical protein